MQAKGYRHGLKPLQELTRRKAELSDSGQARKKCRRPTPGISFAANQRRLLK
jgi:hypothetical protein